MTLNYNQSHMCDDRVGMRGGLLAQSQIIVSSEPNNIICVDTSGSCTTGCKVVQRRSRSLRSMMGASQLPPNLPPGVNANGVWVFKPKMDSQVGEQCRQTFERQGSCAIQNPPPPPPTPAQTPAPTPSPTPPPTPSPTKPATPPKPNPTKRPKPTKKPKPTKPPKPTKASKSTKPPRPTHAAPTKPPKPTKPPSIVDEDLGDDEAQAPEQDDKVATEDEKEHGEQSEQQQE